MYYSPSDINEDIVLKKEINIPKEYSILQNYPNPFNLTTNIEYLLPKNSYVELKVYNILGQEQETLVNEYKWAGKHKIEFNANKLSSGIYIYQLKNQDFVSAKKMILLK